MAVRPVAERRPERSGARKHPTGRQAGDAHRNTEIRKVVSKTQPPRPRPREKIPATKRKFQIPFEEDRKILGKNTLTGGGQVWWDLGGVVWGAEGGAEEPARGRRSRTRAAVSGLRDEVRGQGERAGSGRRPDAG